jgi:hypothetical protein
MLSESLEKIIDPEFKTNVTNLVNAVNKRFKTDIIADIWVDEDIPAVDISLKETARTKGCDSLFFVVLSKYEDEIEYQIACPDEVSGYRQDGFIKIDHSILYTTDLVEASSLMYFIAKGGQKAYNKFHGKLDYEED